MQHIVIENKGYTTQMYEYKGYKIWRSHSSEPFRIEKDYKITIKLLGITNKYKRYEIIDID